MPEKLKYVIIVIVIWHIIALIFSIVQRLSEIWLGIPKFTDSLQKLVSQGDTTKKLLLGLAPFLVIYRAVKIVLLLPAIIILFVALILACIFCVIGFIAVYIYRVFAFAFGNFSRLIRLDIFIQLVGIAANFLLIWKAVVAVGKFTPQTALIVSIVMAFAENLGSYGVIWVFDRWFLEYILRKKPKEIVSEEYIRMKKNFINSIVILPIITVLLIYVFRVDYNFNVAKFELDRTFHTATELYKQAISSTPSNLPAPTMESLGVSPKIMGFVTIALPVICGLLSFVFSKPWSAPIPFNSKPPLSVFGPILFIWGLIKKLAQYLTNDFLAFLAYCAVILLWVYFVIYYFTKNLSKGSE
jgi:hypothetical protein